MIGVYLCARKHRLAGYNIKYNDIVSYPGIDLICSCEDVDLSGFDFIIATPPCNYYSRANYRREKSIVALKTKHLLPYCIESCIKAGKPFIVENVLNASLLPHYPGLYEFEFGQHHFWTNVFMLVPNKSWCKQNKAKVCRNKRDNNYNVDFIIKMFLYLIHER